jgi:hypothetical protein
MARHRPPRDSGAWAFALAAIGLAGAVAWFGTREGGRWPWQHTYDARATRDANPHLEVDFASAQYAGSRGTAQSYPVIALTDRATGARALIVAEAVDGARVKFVACPEQLPVPPDATDVACLGVTGRGGRERRYLVCRHPDATRARAFWADAARGGAPIEGAYLIGPDRFWVAEKGG